jgi:hypothetical protein
MKHTFHNRETCVAEHCATCEGGLAWCVVCGGAESCLPTECPGSRMTGRQLDLISAGNLDYVNGIFFNPMGQKSEDIPVEVEGTSP